MQVDLGSEVDFVRSIWQLIVQLGIISTGPEASGSHLSGAWVACGVRAGCSALVCEGFEEVHTFFHAKVDLGSCSHLESGHYFLLLASGSYLFGVPASPEVYMKISMFIVMRGSTVDTSTYVSIRTRLDECSQSFCVLVDVGS